MTNVIDTMTIAAAIFIHTNYDGYTMYVCENSRRMGAAYIIIYTLYIDTSYINVRVCLHILIIYVSVYIIYINTRVYKSIVTK